MLPNTSSRSTVGIECESEDGSFDGFTFRTDFSIPKVTENKSDRKVTNISHQSACLLAFRYCPGNSRVRSTVRCFDVVRRLGEGSIATFSFENGETLSEMLIASKIVMKDNLIMIMNSQSWYILVNIFRKSI